MRPLGGMFQDHQQIAVITDTTKPYVWYFFYLYKPMIKFNFLLIIMIIILIIIIWLYTYICGNIINNNVKRTHFFWKIYLSHIILERVAKGLCVRGGLETELTATYWPQVPLAIAALVPLSAGLLNQGPEGWFSLPQTTTWTPTHRLQLTQAVCGTRLYNCLTPTCFLWASNLHQIQPVHGQGDTLISSTGCTCYLHWCIS